MGSTTVQAAPPRDYAQETRDTLATQIQLAPQLYQSEQQYQPLYNALQMQMTRDALLGNQNAPGLLDTYSQAIPQLGNISAAANTQQRAADIADVQNLGQQASQAFYNANPELTAALNNATALGGSASNAATSQLNAATAQPYAFNPVSATTLSAGPVSGGPDVAATQINAPDAIAPSTVQSVNAGASLVGAPQGVFSRNVGAGALGNSLYSQALNAGPSTISRGLESAVVNNLTADGSLSPAEMRAAEQQVRASYAARGMAMSPQAISAEVQNRLVNQRQRQMENLSMAQSVNNQLLGEQANNRSFASNVLGQDISRQQTNVANRINTQTTNAQLGLQAALANQSSLNQIGLSNQDAAMRAALANQSAGLQASQINSANQLAAAQANQQSSLQAALANQQNTYNANLATAQLGLQAGQYNQNAALQAALANQGAGMQNYQNWIQNLGQTAQLNNQQTAADRAYAAQLVGLRQSIASDPFQAILGRPSVAFQQAQGYGAQGAANTQMAGPALFNPESSYANNIYGGNQQAINSANIASAQAKSSMIAGIAGGLGALGGGFLAGR